jgi:hypothetical protein
MTNTKYKEKKSRMWVSSTEKRKGKNVKKLKAASNFVFKPEQVFGPKNGYIVQIKVFLQRYEKVSNVYHNNIHFKPLVSPNPV